MPNKPTGKGAGRRGDRDLKTRVKTARKRTTSSTLWLQRQLNDPYVARARAEVKAVKSDPENPTVVGIDYLEMDPVPGAALLQKDFTDEDAPQALFDLLGGHKADIVLSDMAAPTTGHKPTDHLRIIALVEIAADYALDVLAPGGTFVAKVFQGGTEHELLAMLKRNFATTFHAKPPSSRSESAETYLVARGFKGSRQD